MYFDAGCIFDTIRREKLLLKMTAKSLDVDGFTIFDMHVKLIWKFQLNSRHIDMQRVTIS